MGPINAYKLLRKHLDIENILENIKDSNKYKVPNDFDFVSSRNLFKNPCEIKDINIYKDMLNINKPDKEELVKFLHNTKLHDKYFKDIESNLMNYYLNIDSMKIINDDKNHKITEFFVKK